MNTPPQRPSRISSEVRTRHGSSGAAFQEYTDMPIAPRH